MVTFGYHMLILHINTMAMSTLFLQLLVLLFKRNTGIVHPAKIVIGTYKSWCVYQFKPKAMLLLTKGYSNHMFAVWITYIIYCTEFILKFFCTNLHSVCVYVCENKCTFSKLESLVCIFFYLFNQIYNFQTRCAYRDSGMGYGNKVHLWLILNDPVCPQGHS